MISVIKTQNGSALVLTMIFTMVLTVLLLTGLENTMLTTKTVHYFWQRTIAFAAAEQELAVEEGLLQGIQLAEALGDAVVTHSAELIAEDVCGKKRFKITAVAVYEQSSVRLESLYDYLPNPSPACMDEKINRRVWWGYR